MTGVQFDAVTCCSRPVVVAARAPVCQLGATADVAYGAASISCPCPWPSTRGGALRPGVSTPSTVAFLCTTHTIWTCCFVYRACCLLTSHLALQ
ncbi:hypothetical protein V5799_007429 [Amblyomma americanum]|uniref:Uncharacterized protein n=1 Tax=Amblyomma americanum TaxID=6943 RepID=A0AAQ4FGZ4_AMBAM